MRRARDVAAFPLPAVVVEAAVHRAVVVGVALLVVFAAAIGQMCENYCHYSLGTIAKKHHKRFGRGDFICLPCPSQGQQLSFYTSEHGVFFTKFLHVAGIYPDA